MKPHSHVPAGYSPRPLVVYLQPGQSLTIVGVDESGRIPGGAALPPGVPPPPQTQDRIGDSPSRRLDSPSRKPDSPSRKPDSPRRRLDA